MNPRYCPVTQDDENIHRERKEQLTAFRIRNLRLNYGVLFYSLLCVYIATLASFGIARSYWLPSKNLLKSQRMLPDFPNTLVTFAEDDQYVSSLAGEPNSPWNVLAPPGKGFIKVISPATWGLYGGYPVDDGTGSDTESYCISMYHQLHCLAIIKIALTDKHNISHSENIQRGSLSVHSNELSDHNHMMSNDSHHVDHCVDYLRQAIMCAGDTTLEKAGAINGQIGGGVDGWGVTHQCRDWQSIYSYTTKHRNDDVKGTCTVQGILRTSSTVECARDRERLLSLSDFASHPATILLASPEVKAVSSSRRAVSQETSHTYNRTQGSLVELLQTLLTDRIVNEPVTLQTLQTL